MPYWTNLDPFFRVVMGDTLADEDDYVSGTARTEFYEAQAAHEFRIYDYQASPAPGAYEEALYRRVFELQRPVILIGELGSGKSTATRHLLKTIIHRRSEILQVLPCPQEPCCRHPIVVDCIDIEGDTSSREHLLYVLVRLRMAVYGAILDEWFAAHGGLDDTSRDSRTRKLLRRLLLVNDLYLSADVEAREFPFAVRHSELALPAPLLSRAPADWNIAELGRRFSGPVDSLDASLESVVEDVERSTRYTAAVLRLWLQRCNPRSPLSLILLDNIDQLPAESLEQLVARMNVLALRTNARILIPLRPSSITAEGFTYSPEYMYHYGPNGFEMIYRRLSRHVLLRSRRDLAAPTAQRAIFANPPSELEIDALLVTSYLYSLVCLHGLRRQGREGQTAPALHPDHEFLHRVMVSVPALHQLATIVDAVVGISARMALAELRLFFRQLYSGSSVLHDIEVSRIRFGATERVTLPYAQLVTATFGVRADEYGSVGITDLFQPVSWSRGAFPSLVKLRVLAALTALPRMRVRTLLHALAQYGIPNEVAIDTLNYLHAKWRLLVWFSRSTNLGFERSDLDQWVVISHQGITYLRDLAGDFDYLWSCANRMYAPATASVDTRFSSRVAEYRRLLADVAKIDWNQMTFLHCAANALQPEATEPLTGEMLTLFLSYSSLERLLQQIGLIGRRSDDSLHDLIESLNLVLDVVLRNQDQYEAYYGHSGYRVTYAWKLNHARDAARPLLADQRFAGVHKAIEQLLASWEDALHVAGEGLSMADEKDLWDEVFRGLPLAAMRPDTAVGRVTLSEALRPVLQTRDRLRDLLETRFPTYSVVTTEVSYLMSDLRNALDVIAGMRDANGVLTERLRMEHETLKGIAASLSDNAFVVGDNVTLSEMDTMKKRSNAITHDYVTLARRVGAKQVGHLAVSWAV